MTRPLIVALLFLIPLLSEGQSKSKNSKDRKDNILQQVNKINDLLDTYGQLSPFSEDENRFTMIDSIGNEIEDHLLTLLNDQRISNYQLDILLNHPVLSVSRSDDGRIYFVSFDEKTGGSYRTSVTIVHYRLSNGTVKAELMDGEETEALATSVYGHVFLLDSIRQQYFVMGSVLTCNTCIASLAATLTFDTASLHTDVVMIFDGRYYDLNVFEYDSVQKVFSYVYNAPHEDDSPDSEENKHHPLKHVFKGKFRFLDGNFLEVEKCEVCEEEK